jgi:hypothetical protein
VPVAIPKKKLSHREATGLVQSYLFIFPSPAVCSVFFAMAFIFLKKRPEAGSGEPAGRLSRVIPGTFTKKIEEVPSLATGLAGTKLKPVGDLLCAESVIGA